MNLTNIEPIYHPKAGGYFLKFGKKNITRSEKNSMIANLNDQKGRKKTLTTADFVQDQM